MDLLCYSFAALKANIQTSAGDGVLYTFSSCIVFHRSTLRYVQYIKVGCMTGKVGIKLMSESDGG